MARDQLSVVQLRQRDPRSKPAFQAVVQRPISSFDNAIGEPSVLFKFLRTKPVQLHGRPAEYGFTRAKYSTNVREISAAIQLIRNPDIALMQHTYFEYVYRPPREEELEEHKSVVVI